MENATEKLERAGYQDCLKGVPEAQVRRALSAILESPPFHGSAQSRDLLQYIVEQTLSGHFEMLKERVIGAHVFGRPIDYATNDDPIVRARVAEVRKRLAVYFQKARGETVQISIPSGSFKAVFEWVEPPQAQTQAIATPESASNQPEIDTKKSPTPRKMSDHAAPPAHSKLLRRKWWIVLSAALAVLVFAVVRYYPSSEDRAFNQFWSPVLDSPGPVLISIGSNPVYALSSSYIEAYYKEHPGTQNKGMDPYVPLSPDAKFSGKDLILVSGTLVALSDVAATTKILSLMEHRKKHFDFRLGSDMTYGDLREDPTILIGAYNNPWTLSMIENQRYVFSTRADIVDRSNSQKHWTPKTDLTDDYAIVSRALNSKTGKTILIAAGITGAGTRAATEFVSEPRAIAALAKSLPKGWQRKNIEVVLHASVTNGVPSAPEVVASYSW